MLATILATIFLVLHGFVHMLYFAQSAGRFQLKPGMTWPAGSWLLARALGEKATRTFASVVCVLVAAGLVISAVGLISGQAWWRSVAVGSAAVSALLFVLCWDGQRHNLDGQGGIGILIDAIIVVMALIF
jgi:hypothetical protein